MKSFAIRRYFATAIATLPGSMRTSVMLYTSFALTACTSSPQKTTVSHRFAGLPPDCPPRAIATVVESELTDKDPSKPVVLHVGDFLDATNLHEPPATVTSNTLCLESGGIGSGGPHLVFGLTFRGLRGGTAQIRTYDRDQQPVTFTVVVVTPDFGPVRVQ